MEYLTIVRKLDLRDLLKYGFLWVRYAVRFDGDINNPQDDELFDKVTRYINPYDYSYEYLLLHFSLAEDHTDMVISIRMDDERVFNVRMGSTTVSNVRIDADSVRNIYALDRESVRDHRSYFGPEIEISVSPWEKQFHNLFIETEISQGLKGADNLWRIFNMPQEDLRNCKGVVTDESVKEAFHELYSDRPLSNGNLSIWTRLLRYRRDSIQLYPKGIQGHYLDFISVYRQFIETRTSAKEEVPSLKLQNALDELEYKIFNAPQGKKFDDLRKIVEGSYVHSLMKEISDSADFSIVAPLFLFLKTYFTDGIPSVIDDEITKEVIKRAKEFQFEGSLAVYLLGITLGYEKTHDALYELSGYAFISKPVSSDVQKQSMQGLQSAAPDVQAPTREFRDSQSTGQKGSKSKSTSSGSSEIQRSGRHAGNTSSPKDRLATPLPNDQEIEVLTSDEESIDTSVTSVSNLHGEKRQTSDEKSTDTFSTEDGSTNSLSNAPGEEGQNSDGKSSDASSTQAGATNLVSDPQEKEGDHSNEDNAAGVTITGGKGEHSDLAAASITDSADGSETPKSPKPKRKKTTRTSNRKKLNSPKLDFQEEGKSHKA